VGIYTGNGQLVHASSYFGEVVESKIKKGDGCSGAERMTKLRWGIRDIQLIRIMRGITSSKVFDRYEVGIMLYAEGCSAEDVG
jgi:hypothetical protein